MLKYRVTNLKTGRRYEFEAATAAEADARLERKASVYGQANEREVAVEELDPRPSRLAAAWAAADAHAQACLDTNSRSSLLWLAVDPACPVWRRERIMAVQAWWSEVWAHYATIRARIMDGHDAAFDPAVPGPCPWSIWQISGDHA
jgi:hypothetical protein